MKTKMTKIKAGADSVPLFSRMNIDLRNLNHSYRKRFKQGPTVSAPNYPIAAATKRIATVDTRNQE
jgi:hypothetical protein